MTLRVRTTRQSLSFEKPQILIIMNCAALELYTYLQNSNVIARHYDLTMIYNYVDHSDNHLKEVIYGYLKTADVLITQNVHTISWLRNDELFAATKPGCISIKLAFWRFDGFWPLPQHRFSDGFWFLPNEFGDVPSFVDYIDHPLNRGLIRSHYDSELTKFSQIDKAADLPMRDFFMEKHQSFNLFSDHWHPTSYFFFDLSKRIIRLLGFAPDITLRPNTLNNHYRSRLIFNDVARELMLMYDQTFLRCYRHIVRREVFFDFSRYLSSCHKLDSPAEISDIFDSWTAAQGLKPRRHNMTEFGIRSRRDCVDSSSFALDHGEDIVEHSHNTFQVMPQCFDIDLRDLREVSAISIRAAYKFAHARSNTATVRVLVSIDKDEWKILECDDVLSPEDRDDVIFRSEFDDIVIIRYIRILSSLPAFFESHELEIMSMITG